MWKIFVILFSIFCFSWGEGERRCLPLCQPRRGSYSCFSGTNVVRCSSNSLLGFKAEFYCDEEYRLEGEKTLRCLSNGSWSSTPPKCIPECGRRNSEVTLVVNGRLETPGAFPWHVAIYYFIEDNYEYWCGGSLISEYAVLTAAHCTWNVNPEKIIIVLGKFNRNFNVEEKHVQQIKVKKVKMLKTYQDIYGNYNGDLSVIFLEKPAELNKFVKTVCLDWNQEFVDGQLSQDSLGLVVGWGLTENETFSDLLRVVSLPVVSDERCLVTQQQDFRKFITYTSFCAGYINGTSVCNGDSGGGLVFFDENTNRWYLQGIVSVSPRKTGTSFCNPNYYTIFTKVGMFTKWLKKIIQNEEKLLKFTEGNKKDCFSNKSDKKKTTTWTDNNINKNIYRFVQKYFNMSENEFPHSKKILSLLNGN